MKKTFAFTFSTHCTKAFSVRHICGSPFIIALRLFSKYVSAVINTFGQYNNKLTDSSEVFIILQHNFHFISFRRFFSCILHSQMMIYILLWPCAFRLCMCVYHIRVFGENMVYKIIFVQFSGRVTIIMQLAHAGLTGLKTTGKDSRFRYRNQKIY